MRNCELLKEIERQFWSVSEKLNSGNVNSVVFSDDCQYIVSGGNDGMVRLWRGGDWLNWLEVGCDRLRSHPVLENTQTKDAKAAKATCEKYVWNETK